MTERPILMSAPMVRAILDGRKSQTRRVVKYAAPDLVDADGWPLSDRSREGIGDVRASCPYGVPGDRLWVREAFWHQPAEFEPLASMTVPLVPAEMIYRADVAADVLAEEKRRGVPGHLRWKPGIFMPRGLSRLTLELTSVRVERLQELGRADAIAEGIFFDGRWDGWVSDSEGRHYHATDPVESYAGLWEAINGDGSWDAIPWVWVVEFRRA